MPLKWKFFSFFFVEKFLDMRMLCTIQQTRDILRFRFFVYLMVKFVIRLVSFEIVIVPLQMWWFCVLMPNRNRFGEHTNRIGQGVIASTSMNAFTVYTFVCVCFLRVSNLASILKLNVKECVHCYIFFLYVYITSILTWFCAATPAHVWNSIFFLANQFFVSNESLQR